MSSISNDKISALQHGEIELQGEFMWGSNYTFLVMLDFEVEKTAAVYKPSRGVRPLWDFPRTSLAKREVAAYLVGEALAWKLVPPTVMRQEAPFGPGSLQLFIEYDPEYHYFNFSNADLQRLRPTVIFDVIINNADRKGSHIIFDPDGQLWLIDHGICFHETDKLRTVIWDFIGETIPDHLLEDLYRFHEKISPQNGKPSSVAKSLERYISREEVEAIVKRTNGLIERRRFPDPDPKRRQFPWPQI